MSFPTLVIKRIHNNNR